MPHPDDERLGQLMRAVRVRAGLTQEELAELTGIPVHDLHRLEVGSAGNVRLDRIRDAFRAVGGAARLTTWFNGASADRLLDEQHAALVEAAAATFRRRHWITAAEVTFSEYGERGSIDLFAAHEPSNAVAVCEIKSAFGSLEETNRSLDVKVRLAPKLAERTFGWRPRCVGRLLIVPDESTLRRIVRAHETTMDSIYPGRSREVRLWLRDPTFPFAGIWFLSNPPHRRTIPAKVA